MMILRVYAMWNRSRTILYVLLFIFVLQIVTTVVFVGIYNNPNTYFSGTSEMVGQLRMIGLLTFSPVTTIQVQDFSICMASFVNVSPIHYVFLATPRFALGAALVFLAVFRTLKQSLEIYKATRLCELNRYMRQLVKDGVLYFFAYVTVVLYPSSPIVTANGDVFPLPKQHALPNRMYPQPGRGCNKQYIDTPP